MILHQFALQVNVAFVIVWFKVNTPFLIGVSAGQQLSGFPPAAVHPSVAAGAEAGSRCCLDGSGDCHKQSHSAG